MQKNADSSKIRSLLVLKGIFSEIMYKCVLTHQFSSFWDNSNQFYTGWQEEGGIHSPPKNGPLKSPPRLRLKRLSRKLLVLLFLFTVPVSSFVIFVDQQYLHFKTIERFSSFFFRYIYCRVELCKNARIFSYNNIFKSKFTRSSETSSHVFFI